MCPLSVLCIARGRLLFARKPWGVQQQRKNSEVVFANSFQRRSSEFENDQSTLV